MLEVDIFYIIVTVVFVIFLALVLWWLFRFIHKKSILDVKREDLSDDQKQLLYKFCSEMRQKRELEEKKVKDKEQVKDKKQVKDKEQVLYAEPRKKLL